jgi:hypothetical protein
VLTEALHALLRVPWFGGRAELWPPFDALLARLGPNVPAAALTIPGIDRWPFDLARVQLAYGERLRRT